MSGCTLPAAPAAHRPRLWELGDRYHCPVVGTCLPIEDLRKLARRNGAATAAASEFDVHVTAVGYCKTRNAFSESMHKALEQRHHRWVTRFGRARCETAAAALWKEALAGGEAARCGACSPAARRRPS
jgi:hypothetical protein